VRDRSILYYPQTAKSIFDFAHQELLARRGIYWKFNQFPYRDQEFGEP